MKPIKPMNWGIKKANITSTQRGKVCFQFFPFYSPLIGFIGLIDTFPQKCGQNRQKLGVNQISPLALIGTWQGVMEISGGAGCGVAGGVACGLLGLPSPPSRMQKAWGHKVKTPQAVNLRGLFRASCPWALKGSGLSSFLPFPVIILAQVCLLVNASMHAQPQRSGGKI